MNLKVWLVMGLVLVMVVAVTGCMSFPITSSPALSMTAKVVNSITLYGEPTYKIKATINNEHAGTIKLSTSNFLLTDSSGGVHTTIGITQAVNVVENGEGAWFTMSFYVTAGSHPTELTYYDGQNKMVCNID